MKISYMELLDKIVDLDKAIKTKCETEKYEKEFEELTEIYNERYNGLGMILSILSRVNYD